MAAAAMKKDGKTFHINVNIHLKRTKEEIDFAKSETEKLHQLVIGQQEQGWAKERIQRLHEMIFLPDPKAFKKGLVDSIKDDSDLVAASEEAAGDDEKE